MVEGEDSDMVDASNGWRPPPLDHEEVWLMNDHYNLFGEDGAPAVTPQKSFHGRLDECMRCLGDLDGHVVVHIFFADGVIVVSGPDLLSWMRYTGMKVPSEQNLIELIWPNILAASKGEFRTWSCGEAKAARIKGQASEWKGQPTPGVYVWQNNWSKQCEGVYAWKNDLSNGQENRESIGLVENLKYAMQSLVESQISNKEPQRVLEPLSQRSGCVLGLLLEQEGVALHFLTRKPMNQEIKTTCVPKTVVTVLGGPKGVKTETKRSLHEVFQSQGISLLEVSLGQTEQMAHTCLAYLRMMLEDNRLIPALTDLISLGPQRYAELQLALEAKLLS